MIEHHQRKIEAKSQNGTDQTWKFFESIISISSEAVIAIDAHKRIAKFNPRAEAILGYQSGEMIGHPFADLFADPARAADVDQTVQEFGSIDGTELQLKCKDDSLPAVSLSGKLVRDMNGEVLGQIFYIRPTGVMPLLETRLNALIETSKAVNSTSEIDQILEQVIRSAISSIPSAERGTIHIFDEGSKRLQLKASSLEPRLSSWETEEFKEGEGIAGWVFQQQQGVLCSDVSFEKRYKSTTGSKDNPPRSMICVPITFRQRRIGVMTLSHHARESAFSQTDLTLLKGFADQAAVALDNAGRFKSIRKEADELDFLRDISVRINKETEIEKVLESILESGNGLLKTEVAVVHWRGRSDHIVQSFAVPQDMEHLRTTPRTDGLTKEIFTDGKTIIIEDTKDDDRVNPDVVRAGIRSLVGCPLRLDNRVAGALFFNSRQLKHFGEHEIHLLSLLLPLAAVAIDNSNAIDLLNHHRDLSEALLETSSKMAGTQELSEQMAALKKCMLEVFHAPMFYLGMYDQEEDQIDFLINCEDYQDTEGNPIDLKNQQALTISSYVIKHKKQIIWLDKTQKDAECDLYGIHPVTRGKPCQTCLAFPLEIGGNVLGVISIQSPEPHAWDDIEIHTFETLAHQTSISIRNTILLKKLNSVLKTAKGIAEVTTLGNLPNTLDSIVKGMIEVLGCHIVTLWTYWEEKKEFDPRPAFAGAIRHPEMMSQVSRMPKKAAPYMIIDRDEMYVAYDTQQDPLLALPFSFRENVCSSVAVPLITNKHRVGALFINYCHEKHVFEPEELETIRLFSDQAATAIGNAMLYEAEQKRRDILSIVDDAGRTVTGSLQLDEIFDNLARLALNLTGEKGTCAAFASITTVEGSNCSVLQAAYPPEEEAKIRAAGMAEVDLKIGKDGRIGIIGMVVNSRQPLLVPDVSRNDNFLRSSGSTRCELAVPILFSDEVVGVINLEHNEINGLNEEDLQDIQRLAAHAAVAINNARMYQSIKRKSQHQQAIYEASKLINASIDLGEKELLDLLVRQMMEKIVPAGSAKTILGGIHLYDEKKGLLKLECTFPPAAFGSHRAGEERSLHNADGTVNGITSMAVISKKPQCEGDVRKVDCYLKYNDNTRSELDVPLLDHGDVLGVLSLECDRLNGFDQDAEAALSAFAELAVIAILNSRRYQELKETKAMVGNITAVAWMGLVAGAWRHSIGNLSVTISDNALLARDLLKEGETPEKIDKPLAKIQEIVEEIKRVPMPPLSNEPGSGQEIFPICQLVRDRLNQFAVKDNYKIIHFEFVREIDELAVVYASPEWIRRILDILIDNARDAMKHSKVKTLTAVIRPANDGVEVLIKDTGKGIPEALQGLLFKKPIKKGEKEKGSGIGLFLASSIINVYGGRLEIRDTSSDGTTLSLWLPLKK